MYSLLLKRINHSCPLRTQLRLSIQIGVPNRLLSHIYPNRTYHVASIYIHPDYNNDQKLAHDIGLIKVNRRVEMKRRELNPICLPIELNRAIEDDLLSVAGWGAQADSICMTGNGGPGPYQRCQFPFEFRNETFHHCVHFDSPSYWHPTCAKFFHQFRFSAIRSKSVKIIR